jgi:fermentation-respiration switch protein FrsA (DUF1100 family)
MKRKWKLFFIILASILILFGLLTVTVVIPVVAQKKLRYPDHLETYLIPSDKGMTYTNITLTTSDNVDLKAWWIDSNNESAPNANITLVVMHGYSKNKAWMLDHYGDGLYALNYTMLLFDARCRGESPDTEPGVMYGWEEKKDLKAAVDYAKIHGANASQVVIFAESAGAACSIFYTADYNDVAAVIADSSWANGFSMIKQGFPLRSGFPWFIIGQISIKMVENKWGKTFTEISPENYIDQVTTPIFIIHGDADIDINPADAQTLYDGLPASTPKQLWITSGNAHVESYKDPNYFSNVGAFISSVIGGIPL